MTASLNQAFHRETVLGSGVGDERVVRQHGSLGVYAGIRVEVRSLARGKGTVFAWNAGANIPARFATAVAQGVRDAISTAALRQAHPTLLEAISVCRSTFPKEYASAIEESLSSEDVRIESAQSESQTSGFIVTVPTSRVDSLLQQILSVTHGQAKFLIESGGFRPRPEPPDMATVWTSVP